LSVYKACQSNEARGTWSTHNSSHVELFEGQFGGICTRLLRASTSKQKLTVINLHPTIDVQCHLQVLERVKDSISYVELLSTEQRI